MGWFDDNLPPQGTPLAGMTVNPQGSGSTTAITEPGWTTPGGGQMEFGHPDLIANAVQNQSVFGPSSNLTAPPMPQGTPLAGMTVNPQGSGSTTISTAMAGGTGGSAPPYVNMSDPVQAAVWQAYQQKGIQPRDQGDFQYWVDNINRTGGLTGGNAGYWTSRMAQSNGGVGDYGNGSGGGQGGSMGSLGTNMGGPFVAPSLADAQNSPGYQFAQQQGMDAIQRSAAAKGTLLTGGTLKALQGYGTGLADQTYGNVFSRALQANTQNYNQLYGLAGLGTTAATGAAG